MTDVTALSAQVPSVRWSAARAITRPPGHHFFGYYGIPPWNASERLYVCLESASHDRMPRAGERATVGVVDLASGRFEPLASTAAWNLQQGAMLHWLPSAPDTTIVFNDLDSDEGCFRPVVLDVATGAARTVPSPIGIGAVSPGGRSALGLDYARLHAQRPVVGYAGGRDRTAGVHCPDDDGVWLVDLDTGATTLALSHAQALACVPAPPLAHERPLFFNHTLHNPSGTRFLVFLRYFDESGRLDSADFTAAPDGGRLRCIVPWGHRPSHFDWYSDHDVLITTARPSSPADPIGAGGAAGKRHYNLIRDGDGQDEGWAARRVLGGGRAGVLETEGHASFSPDRRWFAFDGERNAEGRRPVRLYDMAGEREIVLGRYFHTPDFKGDVRCDPHPRWNRTGTQVSFDSVHDGSRQVYVVDLSIE
jgi:hypothetical protein